MSTAVVMIEIRTLLGLSQRELATALGCARRSVASYETGKRPVPDDIADQLRHMRRTFIDTRTRLVVRRAIENKVARPMPGFSTGYVPDGWLALVEKALVEIVAAVPPSIFGRPLAVRISAPTGRLALDVALDPTIGTNEVAAGFRQWLHERADRLAADSRTTCARCGGPKASMEISGWAWPLCPSHGIKRKGVDNDVTRAA